MMRSGIAVLTLAAVPRCLPHRLQEHVLGQTRALGVQSGSCAIDLSASLGRGGDPSRSGRHVRLGDDDGRHAGLLVRPDTLLMDVRIIDEGAGASQALRPGSGGADAVSPGAPAVRDGAHGDARSGAGRDAARRRARLLEAQRRGVALAVERISSPRTQERRARSGCARSPSPQLTDCAARARVRVGGAGAPQRQGAPAVSLLDCSPPGDIRQKQQSLEEIALSLSVSCRLGIAEVRGRRRALIGTTRATRRARGAGGCAILRTVMLAKNQTLTVLGCGTMGEAIVRGILRSGRLEPAQIFATDRRAEVVKALREKHGIRTTSDNREAVPRRRRRARVRQAARGRAAAARRRDRRSCSRASW